MIRTRLRFPAGAVAARRRARKRRQRASTITADTNAAEVGPTGKPPIVSSLWADRTAAGREIKPTRAALAANGARLMRVRRAYGRGRARSRGAAGRRSRGRTGTARSPGVGTEADAGPPCSRLGSASTGTGRATVGAAVARGAAKAGARPVFTSRGSAPGAGTTAAGPAEPTAGPCATTRDGSSPVADGPIEGTSAPGSKSSGSRYPFGSEARRTPR
jgi:hypothetical protein